MSSSVEHLEMLNIVVAMKIWVSQWHNSKICKKYDNMTVVEVIASGRTRDRILGACARNIGMLAALNNITIHVDHIAEKDLIEFAADI